MLTAFLAFPRHFLSETQPTPLHVENFVCLNLCLLKCLPTGTSLPLLYKERDDATATASPAWAGLDDVTKIHSEQDPCATREAHTNVVS